MYRCLGAIGAVGLVGASRRDPYMPGRLPRLTMRRLAARRREELQVGERESLLGPLRGVPCVYSRTGAVDRLSVSLSVSSFFSFLLNVR